MSNSMEADYSDSDEETFEGVETSVLLGLSDGRITAAKDLVDPAVSRMGGTPTFLPAITRPPHEISHCKACSNPMELLVQMWCPFEESPFDRVLYVWGCGRSGCQHKDGSVRAFRSVKFNERFAAKLERKREKAKEQQRLKQEAEANKKKAESKPGINPFTLTGSGGPTGLDNQPFGAEGLFGSGNGLSWTSNAANGKASVATTPSGDQEVVGKEVEESVDSDDDEPPATEDEITTLAAALETSSLSSPDSIDDAWLTSPSYTPLYLSTTPEYLAPDPPTLTPKIPKHASDSGNDSSGGGWSGEAYENTSRDEVFEKFKKIVANEGAQCVRYELSGVPLPYQSDRIYSRLFPLNATTRSVVINGRTAMGPPAVSALNKRTYDPSVIPPCPECKGPRAFECQLVPNLINLLKTPSSKAKKQTEVERRNELARVLLKQDVGTAPAGGTTADEKLGMEWGTCIVFSCLSDCCQNVTGPNREVKECWREEHVLVQWEN